MGPSSRFWSPVGYLPLGRLSKYHPIKGMFNGRFPAMRYFLLAFSALLLHSGEGFAKNVKIRWHGQSFFEVESSSGTILAIDPHNLEAYGRRQVKADAVLITHFHIDHASPEPIVDFKATKKIYGLKSRRGLESTRETDEFYDLDEKVKDFHITNMNCYHDDMEGL